MSRREKAGMPQAQRKLWRFHGGLRLPGQKALSNSEPIQAAPLPKRLILPLQQHIGAAAAPVVSVGERVLKGQMIAAAQAFISAPLHAPTSGTVVDIGEYPAPHPSALDTPCIVIDSDGKDEWTQLPQPLSDFHEQSPGTLRQRIREAGIVGLGGATFPSCVKLSPGPQHPIHTLIINGAECEPYITCDDRLMRERAEQILTGIRIMQHVLGTRKCLIGIEDNKPEAIAAMRKAAADMDHTEVVTIPTCYPTGGEKQLIRILTGKEVPSHGLPSQIGMVCHNVGTAAAIADAVLLGRPLISRIVTVTGHGVYKPGNMEVLFGTPANELIKQAGGYTPEASRLILGGPMMGVTLSTDKIPVTKATNCLLIPTRKEVPDPLPAKACIRCGECARVCPVQLLPQQLYWHARANNLEKTQDYNLFDCIECGCCSHVCPSHIPLVQYFRYAKQESWAQEQEQRKAELARQRHEARQARLALQEKERKERLQQKKEALGKKNTADDAKKAAIKSALKRVAQKKAGNEVQPKNTENLTAAQKRQIELADARRSASKQPGPERDSD